MNFCQRSHPLVHLLCSRDLGMDLYVNQPRMSISLCPPVSVPISVFPFISTYIPPFIHILH